MPKVFHEEKKQERLNARVSGRQMEYANRCAERFRIATDGRCVRSRVIQAALDFLESRYGTAWAEEVAA